MAASAAGVSEVFGDARAHSGSFTRGGRDRSCGAKPVARLSAHAPRVEPLGLASLGRYFDQELLVLQLYRAG